MRDGVPYAIDFMNFAPDADIASVGPENLEWVVANMADVLVEMVRGPKTFGLAGIWAKVMNPLKDPRTSIE